MFTGLIAEVGRVERIDRDGAGARISIRAALAGQVAPGDSVAVSGVCLTASGIRADRPGFDAEVMNQTLELTSLGELSDGDRVNLEPALRASDRLGGHIVQGHVDAIGEVLEVREDGIARWLRVGLPAELSRYAIERGSIALDGVSLTIARLDDEAVEVSLIPETVVRTTLGAVREGERLNLEMDLIARHAERLLQSFQTDKGAKE
ncbi:MAG: riboflavin synthase [Actinomycetota bacterium]|nr:riboflavin synthase [Actinomycetota bacterium]